MSPGSVYKPQMGVDMMPFFQHATVRAEVGWDSIDAINRLAGLMH